MQNFIPIDIYFPAHPKTLKLKMLAGKGAAGHLIVLWIWAAKNRPNGDLLAMSNLDIEAAAEWPGQPGMFVVACCESGFFDGNAEHNYALHDWKKWQKHFACLRRRQQTADRVSRLRSRRSVRYSVTHEALHGNANVTPRLEEKKIFEEQDLLRGDKRREDQDPAQKTRWAPPDSLPGFCEFWGLHPHKVEGAECEKIWRRGKLEPQAAEINAALKAQLSWPKYRGDDVAFMKRAPSWLRKRRWEDQAPASAPIENEPPDAATQAYLARKAIADAKWAENDARLRQYDPAELAAREAERNGNGPIRAGKPGVFAEVLAQRARQAGNQPRAISGPQERK